MNIQETIAAMLTENTGAHFLDSGGSNGRAWQQNAGKVVADFQAQPSATAEIYVREWQGKLVAEVLPCVNIFHLLTGGALELDDLCHEFNATPVDDWDGDYNGVSLEGSEWLEARGFAMCKESRGGWNTYNWNAAHSQVMQGNELTLEGEYGEEKYLLLQIHGGADVRGGYTDARLFKLADHAEFYNVVSEDCGFSGDDCSAEDTKYLSWHGEWINEHGSCADDSELLAFALACGASLENPSVTVAGHAYLDF
jgi:hypothetical protein